MNTDTNEVKRYSGPSTISGPYGNEYAVDCPKCKKEALVSNVNYNWKLSCFHCNHVEYAKDLVRYAARVKRTCDNCGQAFEKIVEGNKNKVAEIKVACPECGIERTYPPRNDTYRLVYKNEGVGDPVFNLPLRFQCDVRGHLFWGYNRTHLTEIRNYVASQLRERQVSMRVKMVEKLPNFIKAAKNREQIIKAIDRMLSH